ncbi:MAG: hypothetical protein HYS17_01505 [Micavibrio aeruginosavorus]|uniref:Uncharacterized protein n=1 Tax=Micavibrio aeruginosavorus TaxID=349221 RepID=A0A7T5UH18_9BACT|nr:MAG: hypothetical protein HYS17_01505 [Micavibrio aeruginosavorus]
MSNPKPATDSPTLDQAFATCAKAEDIEAAAAAYLRGPYHHGEMTVFIFRGERNNGMPLQVHVQPDTGIACGEGASMEVDMNQLDTDDMRESAQRWYVRQVGEGKFSLNQKVAVVFDSARNGSPELDGEANTKNFAGILDRESTPGFLERASTTLRRLMGGPSQLSCR